jgi:hypothetical protein
VDFTVKSDSKNKNRHQVTEFQFQFHSKDRPGRELKTIQEDLFSQIEGQGDVLVSGDIDSDWQIDCNFESPGSFNFLVRVIVAYVLKIGCGKNCYLDLRHSKKPLMELAQYYGIRPEWHQQSF